MLGLRATQLYPKLERLSGGRMSPLGQKRSWRVLERCPLYPDEQKSASASMRSENCQKLTLVEDGCLRTLPASKVIHDLRAFGRTGICLFGYAPYSTEV